MKRAWRKKALLGILAVAIVAIAACGGDDEEEATSAATTDTSGTTTTAAAETTTTTTTTTTEAASTTEESSTTETTAKPATAATGLASREAQTATAPVSEHANAVITVEGEASFGGTINRAAFGGWSILDPYVKEHNGAMNVIYMEAYYEPLLQYDAPFDPAKGVVYTPNLAKSWEFSGDGSKLTVRLREGIEWHDGEPFTSADVKATWDRLIAPDFDPSPQAAASFREILKGVEIVDEHTLVLDFGSSSYIALSYLANPMIVITPAHILESKGNLFDFPAVGTGPFIQKWADQTQGMGFEKNPNYWGTDQEGRQLPYTDAMEFPAVPQQATRLALLRAGNVDFWEVFPTIGPTEAKSLKDQMGDDINILNVASGLWTSAVMNTAKPPFDNVLVRQAVAYALDRTAIAAKASGSVEEGGGIPGYYLDPRDFPDFVLSPSEMQNMPGLNPANRAADLARAKQLLAQAGYTDGITIDDGWITYGSQEINNNEATLASSMLEEIGISVEFSPLEGALMGARRREGEFHISSSTNATILADPLGAFLHHTSSGQFEPSTRWSNATFDDMWLKASRTIDTQARKAIVQDIQRYLLMEDAAAIAVQWLTNNAPVWWYVKNYYPGPTIYGSHHLRHVWLEPH